jgi:hypothetical protein
VREAWFIGVSVAHLGARALIAMQIAYVAHLECVGHRLIDHVSVHVWHDGLCRIDTIINDGFVRLLVDLFMSHVQHDDSRGAAQPQSLAK